MLYTIQNLNTHKTISVGPKTNKTVFKPFVLTFKERAHASKVRERLQENKYVIHTNCKNLVVLVPIAENPACTYDTEPIGYNVQEISETSMRLGRDIFIVDEVRDAQQMVLDGTLVELHGSEFGS